MINKKGLIEGRLRYGAKNEREMGDYEKCKECGHEKALHDYGKSACFTASCGCDGFKNSLKNESENRIENDAPPLPGPTLGYDYGTSTTTMTPGESCRECGHTIGQKFYDTNCSCRCHAERANNLGPQGCPSCGSHQYEIAEGQDQVRCKDCGKVSDLTMWNTQCDICHREEGAGLEEHLETRHGLEPDVAAVVAADMEDVRG